MGISKQIGWSPKANLYYQISKQLDRLIGVTSKVVLSPPSIPTVIIGTQTWMSQNLNVDRYANGDLIEEVQDPTEWANLTTGAWCYYENNSANGTTYGKLYNWFAVNDPRGLAPTGYHVPSFSEWTILINHLGGDSVAGGAMKNTTGWNDPNTGATNSSGFTGLPGGYRINDGSFSLLGDYGVWWMSTSLNTTDAGVVNNSNLSEEAILINAPKIAGFSVRAIKD